jgi:hypothetical protein
MKKKYKEGLVVELISGNMDVESYVLFDKLFKITFELCYIILIPLLLIKIK